MKILVVDDDKYFLERMKYLLELDSHLITTATSPIEALQELSYTRYDLVLTDLKMPELSGIDFYNKARESENSSEFLVITGYGSVESAVEAIKAGVYDYLLKPFEISTLRNKIREVEEDLLFRKKLQITNNLNESCNDSNFDLQNAKSKFKSPYLVISSINPEILVNSLKLYHTIPVLLSSSNGTNGNSDHNLDSIRTIIKDFIENNTEGTIIFEGVEKLSNVQKWQDIKNFLFFLQTEIINSHFQLLILIEEKTTLSKINRILSNLTSLNFTRIVKIISHPIRKDIILLLKTMYKVNFSIIFKELLIENPSVLAFHIKKLIEEDIIVKEEKIDSNYYSLSSKGEYLAKITNLFQELGTQAPLIPIKIIPTSRIFEKSPSNSAE